MGTQQKLRSPAWGLCREVLLYIGQPFSECVQGSLTCQAIFVERPFAHTLSRVYCADLPGTTWPVLP